MSRAVLKAAWRDTNVPMVASAIVVVVSYRAVSLSSNRLSTIPYPEEVFNRKS